MESIGCDIHVYVETKSKRDTWILVPQSSFSAADYLINQDRDYQLFSLLCDVRSYGDSNLFISLPKGLPVDVSIEIEKDSDSWGIDAHSHNWNTLQELLDFQKNSIEAALSQWSTHDFANISHDLVKLIFPKEQYQMYQQQYTLKPLIESLQQKANELNCTPDEIRIVYWFDN